MSKKTATFAKTNYRCNRHHNNILSLKSESNKLIWLVVMLLMIKYINKVSFLNLVSIQIQLKNFKCRHFLETSFMMVKLNKILIIVIFFTFGLLKLMAVHVVVMCCFCWFIDGNAHMFTLIWVEFKEPYIRPFNHIVYVIL